MCKKTTGSTGGRWVGQWWVGPKGEIAGVSLSRPLQTTGQHSSVQLFNSQSFDPNLKFSTQVNFNRVGLYRLNSVRRNHRLHRPNRVIPTSHWLSMWPKGCCDFRGFFDLSRNSTRAGNNPSIGFRIFFSFFRNLYYYCSQGLR